MAQDPNANNSTDTVAEQSTCGKQPYVDIRRECRGKLFSETPIAIVESNAIKKRQQTIKHDDRRDRTGAPLTGLALSGGGIRSAAFNLGALQALHAYSGIEGIDYLSTVSGGGYIGCCLTAALAGPRGIDGESQPVEKLIQFPFLPDSEPSSFDDTRSVGHIRDNSNYLKPNGQSDMISSIYVIGRGIVANAIIIAPVLFLIAAFALWNHPTVISLSQPSAKLIWALSFPSISPLRNFVSGLPGFWNTAILASVNIAFLVLWAIFRTILAPIAEHWPKYKYTVFDVFTCFSIRLFYVTLFFLAFDVHILVLKWWATDALNQQEVARAVASSKQELSLRNWGNTIRTALPLIQSALAIIGTVFAFLSKYIGEVRARAETSPFWSDWFKKIAASGALWFAALFVPLLLWDFCLWLSLVGLTAGDQSGAPSDYPFAPQWLADAAIAARSHLPFGATAADLYVRAAIISAATATLLIDPNATSLHSLYAKRLTDAFLIDPTPENDASKRQELNNICPKLHKIETRLCPYPIINASINLQGSRYANQRGRDADFFVFTPDFIGSHATGYIGTSYVEEIDPGINLGAAMAISGAAVSPNMGAATIRPLSFTLAFLNIRLGYWLPNPKYLTSSVDRALAAVIRTPLGLLLKEMFSRISEENRIVYLTDGGNLENLGIYELLRRRCKLIIAIDAEQDATLNFPSFLTLERFARIDLGAIIDLPWKTITDNHQAFESAFGKKTSATSPLPGLHCAAGEIKYSESETGVLLYFKSSLSGDEDDYILDYKRRNPAFPHETTGDQFFGEEQFEVYRALGFHVVNGVFNKEKPFAVKPRHGETEDQARGRIRLLIDEALRSPKTGIPPTY